MRMIVKTLYQLVSLEKVVVVGHSAGIPSKQGKKMKDLLLLFFGFWTWSELDQHSLYFLSLRTVAFAMITFMIGLVSFAVLTIYMYMHCIHYMFCP